VTTADAPYTQELDNLIAQFKIRIEQQRIHAKELSGDPLQQKHARAELVVARAGLAGLLDLRKRATRFCRTRPSQRRRRGHRFDGTSCTTSSGSR
jgi:hypothetical protein